MAVYVDNMMVERMNGVKQVPANRFKMKDLGEIHYWAWNIHREICFVIQHRVKYGLSEANTVATLMDANVQLRKMKAKSARIEENRIMTGEKFHHSPLCTSEHNTWLLTNIPFDSLIHHSHI